MVGACGKAVAVALIVALGAGVLDGPIVGSNVGVGRRVLVGLALGVGLCVGEGVLVTVWVTVLVSDGVLDGRKVGVAVRLGV